MFNTTGSPIKLKLRVVYRLFFLEKIMYLLYIDESGSTTDPTQQHFVLSGIAVFERDTHWIEQSMNEIANRFLPTSPYDLELHGSPMRSGKSEWREFPMAERIQAICDCLQIIKDKRIKIFASVIQQGYSSGQDTITECFEQIASRFDMFLARLHAQGNTQRGITIFDKSSTEKSIQALARTFRQDGYTYGKIRNFSEVPLFLDSKSSCLIQLADLVSYAIYRKFEHQDEQFFNIIESCFDTHNGKKHGLYLRQNIEK